MEHKYSDRDNTLHSMGFNSYKDYLQSELWVSIRENALDFYGRSCRLCNKTASIVHHLGYGRAVLEGKSFSQLVPLCNGCHYKIEFHADGSKRTLLETHGQYIRLWNKIKYAKKQTKEGRLGLIGYCKRCGYKARKGNHYCKPCQNLVDKE